MMSAEMTNTSTELAKTRNRAAAERTTLAWIRTALALISFGFGLDKIISAIRDAGGNGNASQDIGVQLMSMGFIGVGIFTLLIAMRQHKRELIRLRSDPYLYRDEAFSFNCHSNSCSGDRSLGILYCCFPD